jgi:tRNA(Ile)-lysidine synthase
MLERFLKFIAENCLCDKQDKIILSVSGGIDSMVMADLFINTGFDNTAIVHCNFKLRGKESDLDEELVRDFAHTHQLPFYSKAFDTKKFAERNKCSIQMAARELRIGWAQKLLGDENYRYYATAHHLDDQIETFFINIFRGTGISGIRGLLPKQGFLIHPLLFSTKNDLITYAKERGINFREDATNKEIDYQRNKIRHLLIPVIEEIYPQYRTTLSKNMENFKQVERVYKFQIEILQKDVVADQNDSVKVSIRKLQETPFAEICLYEILKPLGFNVQDVNDIYTGLDSQSGKRYYSSTHRLVKDRDYLLIEPISNIKNDSFLIEHKTEKIKMPVDLLISRFERSSDFNIPADQKLAVVDSSKLEYPLIIRKWEKGDYFYPLGMSGKKLISDYFIDEKIPLPLKEKTYLLLSGRDIVWIIGHRLDDRFKITNHTEHVTLFRLL